MKQARALRKIAFETHLVSAFLLVGSFWMNENIYALHYRTGASTFGGSHVVFPLLNGSIVSGDIVSQPNFFAA